MNTTNIRTESVLSNGHIYPQYLPIGTQLVNHWGKTVTVVAHHYYDMNAEPTEPYGC